MELTKQIEERKRQIADYLERLNSRINMYVEDHENPTTRNVDLLGKLIDSIDQAMDLMPPD